MKHTEDCVKEIEEVIFEQLVGEDQTEEYYKDFIDKEFPCD